MSPITPYSPDREVTSIFSFKILNGDPIERPFQLNIWVLYYRWLYICGISGFLNRAKLLYG